MDEFKPPRQPASADVEYKHKLIRHEFGDGYCQVVAEGLHPVKAEWNVSWAGLSESESATILDFIKEHAGKRFAWRLDGKRRVLMVTAHRTTKALYTDLSVQLEEF